MAVRWRRDTRRCRVARDPAGARTAAGRAQPAARNLADPGLGQPATNHEALTMFGGTPIQAMPSPAAATHAADQVAQQAQTAAPTAPHQRTKAAQRWSDDTQTVGEEG